MEKSYGRKRVESKCEKDKGFLYWRENYRIAKKKTEGVDFPSFHTLYVTEEEEKTLFYASNVTVGCTKDALAYESVY